MRSAQKWQKITQNIVNAGSEIQDEQAIGIPIKFTSPTPKTRTTSNKYSTTTNAAFETSYSRMVNTAGELELKKKNVYMSASYQALSHKLHNRNPYHMTKVSNKFFESFIIISTIQTE